MGDSLSLNDLKIELLGFCWVGFDLGFVISGNCLDQLELSFFYLWVCKRRGCFCDILFPICINSTVNLSSSSDQVFCGFLICECRLQK